jgi:hypothetical protein
MARVASPSAHPIRNTGPASSGNSGLTFLPSGGIPVFEGLLARQLSLGDRGEHVEQQAHRGVPDPQAVEDNRANRDASEMAPPVLVLRS